MFGFNKKKPMSASEPQPRFSMVYAAPPPGVSAMPSKAEVDMQFAALLEELGLPKAAKEAALKQATETKWAMIDSRNKKDAAKVRVARCELGSESEHATWRS